MRMLRLIKIIYMLALGYSLWCLDGRYSRTIAYVAILMCQCGRRTCSRFSYEFLWNFVVDYFEDPADPESRLLPTSSLNGGQSASFPILLGDRRQRQQLQTRGNDL
ncbi:hypothetical protein IW262DRAFT_1416140 [Armillaria fumosa]|nr:hypothetical protein IW262DRAFT_1416140 [Armillaria fumosa]